MVKCLPEFECFFTVFLKNRNFISKIKRSKVTDYAALSDSLSGKHSFSLFESDRFTHGLLYNIHCSKYLKEHLVHFQRR